MSKHSPNNTLQFEVVKSLVPDWMDIELQYANAKHGLNNPQRSTFEDGGLENGGRAYGDIYTYLSRFVVLATQVGEDEQGLLEASRLLGKWTGTGRALVSASWQQAQGLTIATADERTAAEFLLEWNSIDDFGDLPEPEYMYDALGNKTEELIENIRNGLPDALVVGFEATQLMLHQAKILGAFTLEHNLMATPGTDSKMEPATHWPAFRVN